MFGLRVVGLGVLVSWTANGNEKFIIISPKIIIGLFLRAMVYRFEFGLTIIESRMNVYVFNPDLNRLASRPLVFLFVVFNFYLYLITDSLPLWLLCLLALLVALLSHECLPFFSFSSSLYSLALSSSLFVLVLSSLVLFVSLSNARVTRHRGYFIS